MPDELRERLDETLHRFLDLLDLTGVSAVVIGGVAAGFLAEARLTQDIDATARLDNDDLDSFFAAAAGLGLQPRVPEHISFAKWTRIVLLEDVASRVGVDVSTAVTPFELHAISRPIGVTSRDVCSRSFRLKASR